MTRHCGYNGSVTAAISLLLLILSMLLVPMSCQEYQSDNQKNQAQSNSAGFLESIWEKLLKQVHAQGGSSSTSMSGKAPVASSSKQPPGRRRVLYQHTLTSHYANYMSRQEQETLLQRGNNQKDQEPQETTTTEEEEDWILEADNGCLWYNEGQDSYWTYKWCPNHVMEQVHLIPDKSGTWIPDVAHTLGTFVSNPSLQEQSSWQRALTLVVHEDSLEPEKLQYYHNGNDCAFVTKSTGQTKQRKAVLVLQNDNCPTRRILRVEEPFACDYVVHVCWPRERDEEEEGEDEYEEQSGIQKEARDGSKQTRTNTKQSKSTTTTPDNTDETTSSTINDSTDSNNSHDEIMKRLLRNYIHHSPATLAVDRTTPLHISLPPFPPSRKEANLQLVRDMFTHAYDSYIYHAFPASEIKPLSCKPGTFHLVRLPALTLMDSLDTLVVLKNYTEFARSVERIRDLHDAILDTGGLFAVNQNVSVFETNIRVLGGLLSAHQLAVAYLDKAVLQNDVWDEHGHVKLGGISSKNEQSRTRNLLQDKQVCPVRDSSGNDLSWLESTLFYMGFDAIIKQPVRKDQCWNNSTISKHQMKRYWKYDGILLRLARDLGERLLPAFETKTGIPYGTVNLLHGIPPGETTVASLAGGGTLTLEMELLSRMTGNETFGKAAKLASRALWMRRSPKLNLLGKHIDIHRGEWTETLSGIGSNSDSFYEYLIKHYILFPQDNDFWTMLVSVYNGLHNDTRLGEWYADVDMNMGVRQGGGRRVFESLMAFYPGMQVLLGELSPAARTLNSFFIVREYLGFLPERFNYGFWQVDGGGAGHHPLRPELLESCYFLHRATSGLGGGDSGSGTMSGWLWAADFSLHALQDFTHAKCGYASIKGVSPSTTGSFLRDVFSSSSSIERHQHLVNEMPSFFLSETLKYLYLLFDDDNIIHTDTEREWVFTTEAHPIHHVPPGSSGDPSIKGGGEEEWLEKQAARLESRLRQRLTKRRELVEIRRPVMSAALENRKEKWSEMTPSSVYSDHLFNSEKDTVERKQQLQGKLDENKVALEFKQPFLGPLLPVTPESGPEGEENLAHVAFESHGLGNGASLKKSCPNFHNSELLWVRALNGGAVDYSDMYVSSASNDDPSDEDDESTSVWMMSALDAAAHYGTGLYLGIPSEGQGPTCPLSSNNDDRRNTVDSSATPSGSLLSLPTERISVAGAGEFDIALFDGGSGFYTRHVESDESISATFYSGEDPEFVLVYLRSLETQEPESKETDGEASTMDLKVSPSPKPSWRTSLKSIFHRGGGPAKKPKKKPRYRGQVAFTDSNSDTFICSISVVKKTVLQQETSEGDEIVTEQEDSLEEFPCTPALFGPTHIGNLMETGGLEMEGKVRAPPATDPTSCDHEKDDAEKEGAGLIQLVVRGGCTFEDKAYNQRNARAVVAVNSIDDDLFLMSPGTTSFDSDESRGDMPPIVLVSRVDGMEIQRLLEQHTAPPKSAEKESSDTSESFVFARIRLTAQRGKIESGKIEPSEKDGIVDWPWVSSQPGQIRLFAPSGWGVQAIDAGSSTDENNGNPRWQLFLLAHNTS